MEQITKNTKDCIVKNEVAARVSCRYNQAKIRTNKFSGLKYVRSLLLQCNVSKAFKIVSSLVRPPMVILSVSDRMIRTAMNRKMLVLKLLFLFISDTFKFN